MLQWYIYPSTFFIKYKKNKVPYETCAVLTFLKENVIYDILKVCFCQKTYTLLVQIC